MCSVNFQQWVPLKAKVMSFMLCFSYLMTEKSEEPYMVKCAQFQGIGLVGMWQSDLQITRISATNLHIVVE